MITKDDIKKFRRSIDDVERLFEEYQESMLFIMDEKIAETEQHCECVAPLKIRIKELEDRIWDMDKFIEYRDNKIKILSDWARELPEPYVTEFFNLLANGRKNP